MKKSLIVLLLIAVLVSFTACYTHTHIVGNGAQTGQEINQTQWYALFGLIPLNHVDTATMAGGAGNYTIQTEQTFVDGLISIFTSYVTISRQTVTVKK